VERCRGHIRPRNVRVKGRADLDDVVLAPVANSFIGTKTWKATNAEEFRCGAKNRIMCCYRDAAQANSFFDSEIRHESKSSVRVSPEGDWFALASVNYPLPGWTERLELSGWARTEGSASAQLLACWTDDAQQVLRVDTNNPTTGAAWQRISLVPPAPPLEHERAPGGGRARRSRLVRRFRSFAPSPQQRQIAYSSIKWAMNSGTKNRRGRGKLPAQIRG